MNLVKAFTVLALSACTTAGVVAAASVEASTQVVAEETRTLYFKSEVGWADANAVIDAWVWGGTSDTWVDFSRLENDDGVFTFNVPSGTTGMKIYRRSPSSAVHDHDNNRWNLSGNISLDTEKDFLVHTSDWDNWTYDKLNTSKAYWTTYNPKNPGRIYFASEWGVSKTYIYSFGTNERYGAYPGTLVSTYIEMVKYDNKDILYVDTPNDFRDTSIIFNDGTNGTVGHKTSDLTYNVGNFYKNDSVVPVTGDETLGAAAAFAKEFNDARNGASGYSICNISSETRSSLLAKYNQLDADVKNYFDSFTLNTYSASVTPEDVANAGDIDSLSHSDFTLADVMAQLASMQNSAASNAARLAPIMDEKKTPYYVIAVIFTLSAATVLFVGVRKRKHN